MVVYILTQLIKMRADRKEADMMLTAILWLPLSSGRKSIELQIKIHY